MKKIKYAILLVLISSVVLYASDLINYIKAESDGKTITVEWKSNDESNVTRYEVERTDDPKVNIYKQVSLLNAKGSYQTYQFEDKDDELMKASGNSSSPQAKASYCYRLRIVNSDETANYSNAVSVSHKASYFKRSWGMIKEMLK
ncbi:MAG: hypothetical protein NT007_07195 [Candidatus Kapabacteria bacterium]|nr:hypothetical protein [Candidatus Kapabacteria bacterium]